MNQSGSGPPRFATGLGRRELDEAELEMILNQRAASTRKSYRSRWRWWALFCDRRGCSPLRKVTDANREQEEQIFVDFVYFCCSSGRWAPDALKGSLGQPA